MEINKLKRAFGKGTKTGTVIYTVPANSTITIVGLRGANIDNTTERLFSVKINTCCIAGIDTQLPIGSALDIMVGSKVVAEAGDQIIAYADVDNTIDVYLSFLLQSE